MTIHRKEEPTVIPVPARMKRLSTKLLGLTALSLFVAMIAIGYTLVLSWKLEGGAAAINDAGSLRMRSYHLAYLLAQGAPAQAVRNEAGIFEDTLERLQRGDPARPLFLPDNADVREQAALIARRWQDDIRPRVDHSVDTPAAGLRLSAEAVDGFVGEIDRLVGLVERDNARNTTLLRLFQTVLIALAIAGTVTMTYLMFLLIIRPLNALGGAISRLRDGDLNVRVPVETDDEFGLLSAGFNQMADRLQDLYITLEQKVRDKTQALENRNRQLSTLYEITAFLHESHSQTSMCEGFIERLMALFNADAGSVRLVDMERNRLDQIAHRGLPPELVREEECMPIAGCYCGDAVSQPFAVLHRFDHQPEDVQKTCSRLGFAAISVFHIRHNHQDIGIFTLYFRGSHTLSAADQFLIEALGQHLGVAIENQRLAARDRQFAVAEERNLMAQGLHDSIAQSLSFLNLQVQMLEDALAQGDQPGADENLAFIREGIQECYEDVRELLLNFRTRISREEFPAAVRSVLGRFEKQAQVSTSLEMEGNGLPLNPQEQLQVIFILQEALSNVRKHAGANRVKVAIRNAGDFMMTIDDDGCGFDPETVTGKQARHVGLSIMHERASRIHATIHISSVPGHGTRLELVLPKEERIAA